MAVVLVRTHGSVHAGLTGPSRMASTSHVLVGHARLRAVRSTALPHVPSFACLLACLLALPCLAAALMASIWSSRTPPLPSSPHPFPSQARSPRFPRRFQASCVVVRPATPPPSKPLLVSLTRSRLNSSQHPSIPQIGSGNPGRLATSYTSIRLEGG